MKNPNDDERKIDEELAALENSQALDCFLVYSGKKTWAQIFAEREAKEREEES